MVLTYWYNVYIIYSMFFNFEKNNNVYGLVNFILTLYKLSTTK